MARKKAAQPDAMGALAAVAVAENPELKARVLRIMNLALDDVEHVFRYGDIRERVVYTRQLVPMMMKGLQDADAGAADEKQQAAYDRMMAMLRGDGGPDPPPAEA